MEDVKSLSDVYNTTSLRTAKRVAIFFDDPLREEEQCWTFLALGTTFHRELPIGEYDAHPYSLTDNWDNAFKSCPYKMDRRLAPVWHRGVDGTYGSEAKYIKRVTLLETVSDPEEFRSLRNARPLFDLPKVKKSDCDSLRDALQTETDFVVRFQIEGHTQDFYVYKPETRMADDWGFGAVRPLPQNKWRTETHVLFRLDELSECIRSSDKDVPLRNRLIDGLTRFKIGNLCDFATLPPIIGVYALPLRAFVQQRCYRHPFDGSPGLSVIGQAMESAVVSELLETQQPFRQYLDLAHPRRSDGYDTHPDVLKERQDKLDREERDRDIARRVAEEMN